MMHSQASDKLLDEDVYTDSSASHMSCPSSTMYSGSLAETNRLTTFTNQESQSNFIEKKIKRDDGDYYWANFEWKWTLLDQKRLVSMDYLIHRSLEFHNNHHTFRASGKFDYTDVMGDPMMNDLAMEVQAYHPTDTIPRPSQHLQFGDLERGELSRYPVDRESSGNVFWFNLKDIRSLRPLTIHLQMDNIALSLFYDLRGHSTISALENGLFMSFCIVTLNGDDAELHKVRCFIYCFQTI